MSHLIDADYSQEFLLPPSLEEWVGPDHPARFIREFVDALDLQAMGISWAQGEGGRPAYAAGLLLKVWLYGYFERVRSTRRLEKACRDHVGFIWLTGMHVPDHNTLSTFFRANKKGIRALFRKTVEVAVRADLVGFVLHAVDGTKIAAQVANRSGWHKKQLLKLLQKLDRELDEFEAQLKEHDSACPSSDALPEGVQDKQALREKVRRALDELEESGENHLHPADKDARVMQCKEQNRNAFAYNGQAVADEKEGVLVACDVTQDRNDEQQLDVMLDQVEEQAGRGADRTLADTGYATGAEFAKAEAKQRDIVVALPEKMRPNPDKPYAVSNFIYDEERGLCICPHGVELVFCGEHDRKERGYRQRRYRCTATDCPHRAHCTKNKTGRTVTVTQYHQIVKRQREKQEEPSIQADLKKRGHIIEPVFAFLKQHLGFRRFTHCGLENIQTQWALLCTTYNLHKLFRHWRRGTIQFNPPRDCPKRGVPAARGGLEPSSMTPHDASPRPWGAWGPPCGALVT